MATDFDKIKLQHDRAEEKFKAVKKAIENNRDYYKGKQWDDNAGQQYNEEVVDNMVYKMISTMIASILLRNPRYFVRSKKKPFNTPNGIFDTIRSAQAVEVLANYYVSKLNLKREVRKCALDAMIGGYGIVELGYTFETEEVGNAKEESNTKENNETETAKEEYKEGEVFEVNELIVEDSPYIVRRSPLDLRIDPNAKDTLLHDAEWIAWRVVKTIDDAREYFGKKELKPNFTPQKEKSDYVQSPSINANKQTGADCGLFEYWERWDKREKRICCYALDGENEILSEKDWPIDFGKAFNIEVLYFNENPDDCYPISDVTLMRQQQDMLNRMESLQLDHVKRISQRKYLAQEGQMSEDEMRKLETGPDGTIALVKSDPNAAILPLRDATIAQDHYVLQNQIKNNIREVMGIAAYESGVAVNFETAAEQSSMTSAINAKRDDRRDVVEDFYIRIMRKLLVIIKETMDKEEIPLTQNQLNALKTVIPDKIAKIVGPTGEVLLPWLTLTNEDIQGEYEFSVSVGSTAPDNLAQRKSDYMQLTKAFAGNPYINTAAATKYGLQLFGAPEAEELMKNPEEVDAQMAQSAQAAQQSELQIEQMKKQIDMLKAQLKSETSIRVAEINSGAMKDVQDKKSQTDAMLLVADHGFNKLSQEDAKQQQHMEGMDNA